MAITLTEVANFNTESSRPDNGPGYDITWTGVSIGSAASDRIVVVALAARDGNLPTTMTIGGVTATKATETSWNNKAYAGIWYAAIPTGTTADIVWSTINYTIEYAGTVYTLTGSESTHYSANSDSTGYPNSIDTEIATEANAAVIAVSYNHGDGPETPTWTNVSEDYRYNTSGSRVVSTASNTNVAANSALNINVGWSAYDDMSIAAASFSPAAVTAIDANTTVTEANDTLSSDVDVDIDVELTVTEADDTVSSTATDGTITLTDGGDLGSPSFNTTGSVYEATWSNVDIGSSSDDRIVVVAVGARDGLIPTTMTINGVTATKAAETTEENINFGKATTALFYAVVDTGTTANIIWDLQNWSTDFGGHVYTITGANTTHYSANAISGSYVTSVNTDVAVENGGVIIGASYSLNTTATASWTNLTEDSEVDPGSSRVFTTASENNAAANSALNVKIDYTGSERTSLAVVSFSSLIGPSTGNVAITEAPDTLSSEVDILIDVELADTDVSDSLASNTAIAITGTLAKTSDADTLSSTVVITTPASLSATEADDTASSEVDVLVDAELTKTDDSDTLSSEVDIAIGSTLASTSADDTLSSEIDVTVTGSHSSTDANDTLSSDVDLRTVVISPTTVDGNFEDNSAPYNMSMTISPPNNSIVVVGVTSVRPDGHHSNISFTDNASGTWTEIDQFSVTEPNSNDAFTSAFFYRSVNTITESISVVLTSDDIHGPTVWTFFYVEGMDHLDPTFNITSNSGFGEVNPGPDLTFATNTYSDSQVIIQLGTMDADGGTSDIYLLGNTNSLRETGRVSGIGETSARVWYHVGNNAGGDQTFSFANAQFTSPSNTVWVAHALELIPSYIVGNPVTLSITNDAETVSATANVDIGITLAVTNDNDSLVSNTAIAIIGDLDVTTGDDNISSETDVLVEGELSATESDATLASTTTAVTPASLSITEADDTISVAGSVLVSADLDVTSGTDSLSSNVAVDITATLAITAANDALDSNSAIAIVGTLSKTSDDDTLSSEVDVITDGELSITNEDETLSSSGLVIYTATLDATNADETLSSLTEALIALTASITNEDDAISSESAVLISGTFSKTSADDTVASNTAVTVTATLSITDAADTLSANGITVYRNANLTITEASDTLEAELSAKVTIANTVSSQFNDNTAPYNMSTTISPTGNQTVVVVLAGVKPDGYHADFYVNDNTGVTWTEIFQDTITDGTTNDVLHIAAFYRHVANAETISASIRSDTVIGPTIWDYLYIDGMDTVSPLFKLSGFESGTGNTTGPTLTFAANTADQSAVIMLGATMRDGGGGTISQIPGESVLRETSRLSTVAETQARVYYLLLDPEAGEDSYAFANTADSPDVWAARAIEFYSVNGPLEATVTKTDDNDSLSSEAEATTFAEITATEEDDSASSSVSVPITSSVSITETDESIPVDSGSVSVAISGSLNVTEASDTPPQPQNASVNATEAPDTASSSSTVQDAPQAGNFPASKPYRAHRNNDPRICGAKTVVTGQTSVFIDGELWAVKDDPNDHGGGNLINTTGSSVTINGKPVIVHGPDEAAADTRLFPPHDNPKTADGAVLTTCYT